MDFLLRYRFNPLTDLLGKGGFAQVYKAHDTVLDIPVALKVFKGISTTGSVIGEIRRAVRLEHPSLCHYYEIASLTTKNGLGLDEVMEVGVMEYLDGGNLAEYWLRADETIRRKLLTDVLHGLAYLHEEEIVHRDLKPQNILIKQTRNTH